MSEKNIPIEISQSEMFYQKQVMNPYSTGGQSYTAYEKGFVECFNLFFSSPMSRGVFMKGVKGFPIKKRVIAKFKHYDDPQRDWVVGWAASSTGEMITFDWNVSSITLDINHERWNMLYWLDETAEQPVREVEAEAFAKYLDEQRSGHTADMWAEKAIWDKPNAFQEWLKYFKQQKEK